MTYLGLCGGATCCKVVDLIPDGLIRIVDRLNLSTCTLALGSTHPLTEMRIRMFPGGGLGGECEGLTTFNLTTLMCQLSRNSGSLILLEP